MPKAHRKFLHILHNTSTSSESVHGEPQDVNFTFLVKVGHVIQSILTLEWARTIVGRIISFAPFTTLSRTTAGHVITRFVTGTAAFPLVTTGHVDTTKNAATVKPPTTKGHKVRQYFFELQGDYRSVSVTEDVISGDDTWSNPNNGFVVDATYAVFRSIATLLGDATSELTYTFVAMPNKSSLTIINARLLVIGNGTGSDATVGPDFRKTEVHVAYTLTGGVRTPWFGVTLLALNTSYTTELTFPTGTTFAQLNGMKVHVKGIIPLINKAVSVVNHDAVTLAVVAESVTLT